MQQSVNMQDDKVSPTSMDCGSASELDEADLGANGRNAAQMQCSNGQKPSSPGPHPVKPTSFERKSPNLEPNFALNAAASSSASNDMDMLTSPDSSTCKTMLANNSADREHVGSVSAEGPGFAESHQFALISDPEMGTCMEDGIMEHSGPSNVTDTGSKSSLICHRY